MMFMPAGAHRNKVTRLNVGVIGKSGCGKSTLINSFCRTKVAETDVIECTGQPTPYERSIGNAEISDVEREVCDMYDTEYEVVLWDCPGFGTLRYPPEKYLKRLPVENFDFYLLLSCTRVLEFELAINNFIAAQNKTYFYVRTKIDRDIINDKRSHPRTSSEEKVKRSIREYIQENISSEPSVFFVNAKDHTAYDFPQLEAMLVLYASSSKREGEKIRR